MLLIHICSAFMLQSGFLDTEYLHVPVCPRTWPSRKKPVARKTIRAPDTYDDEHNTNLIDSFSNISFLHHPVAPQIETIQNLAIQEIGEHHYLHHCCPDKE